MYDPFCARNKSALTRRHSSTAGILGLFIAVGLTMCVSEARADRIRLIKETVETVMSKFARDVAGETAESLTARLTRLAAHHGDDAIEAFRKAGPQTLRLAEEAGEHAPTVIRALAQHGSDAAWLASAPRELSLAARLGDDAAEALLRHKGIAAPIIDRFDDAAVRALNAVDGRNARRLAMMHDAGDLARIGRTDQLLGVVERFGDRAAAFVWRNKGALGVSAGLAAFLREPEPFLNGTRRLTEAALDSAGAVAAEAARGVNWTTIALAGTALLGVLMYLRTRRAGIPGKKDDSIRAANR